MASTDRGSIRLKPEVYEMQILSEDASIYQGKTNIKFDSGASYTITISDSKLAKNDISTSIIQDINSNEVSMLKIIPQYFVITIAEILISVTGLEFAYTQAPATMKSLVMSGWLLTNSIGNVIVMIVAESSLVKNQVYEYLAYATMILIADIIFIFLSVFYYEYVPPKEFSKFKYPRHVFVLKDGHTKPIQQFFRRVSLE